MASVRTANRTEYAGRLTCEQREQLVLDHLHQVKLIAGRIRERLPASVSLEDLVSAGMMGLIAAIDRYDPSLGVKLKTYAEYKVRGAILDSLRRLDWIPRQARQRSKRIEAAIHSLENTLQRRPTDGEIADFLDIPVLEYHRWLSAGSSVMVQSLELATTDGGKWNLSCITADADEHCPSKAAEQAELRRVLAEAIRRMLKIEQTILTLYYYQEMPMSQIAKLLKVHESRVSQLKSQAVSKLRSWLQTRNLAP